MSIFRSIILVILVSLLVGIGLFYLGSSLGFEQFRGGYAVLTTDISADDRALGELLETGGSIFWGSPVSESTQWVMLDVFGSMEKVPLDRFSSRVLPSDPRNDGYAEKLNNVFIKNDKRLFYLPLLAGNWNSTLLNRQFNNLLQDRLFTVEYYGIGKPVFLFFISYAAASLCLIILCYAKKQRNPEGFIVLIPVLSSLVFFGTSGIACAALLFGFFFLYREPLNDLVKLPGISSNSVPYQKNNKNWIKLIEKEILKPYRLHFIFLPVFIVAFGIIITISQLRFSFFIIVFFTALAVFLVSTKIISGVSWSRKRFSPVLIIRRSIPDFAFTLFIVPFAVAAFIAMFFTPYVSGAYISDGKFDSWVDEQDYYAHLSFQASFSVRQFGASTLVYPDYQIDTDGLPIPLGDSFLEQISGIDDMPPFPLKHLMDFFRDFSMERNNSGKPTENPGRTGGLPEKLSILVLLLFILSGLFIKDRKNYQSKINFSSFKKSAGKLRFFSINRNVLFGNERIKKQIRKDA